MFSFGSGFWGEESPKTIIHFFIVDPKNVSLFKWQYGAGPAAGAGAKIRREKNVELELSL